MKLLIDENVPNSVTKLLSDYDVLDLKQHQRGLRDSTIIRLAQEQERTILTKDKDFLRLHKTNKESFSAIILAYKNLDSCKKHLAASMNKIAKQEITNATILLTEQTITIHKPQKNN